MNWIIKIIKWIQKCWKGENLEDWWSNFYYKNQNNKNIFPH